MSEPSESPSRQTHPISSMAEVAHVPTTSVPQPEDTQPPRAEDTQPPQIADTDLQRLQPLVERGQKVMSSAWMVRTFIKHSDEVEDYPELNELARTIFDIYRAVETQVDHPVDYFKVVRKKIGKLEAAAIQFQKDAWHASTHTNFQQAGVSALFIVEQLRELLRAADEIVPPPAPPKITLPPRA